MSISLRQNSKSLAQHLNVFSSLKKACHRLWQAFFTPSFSPEFLIVLSCFITALHSADLVDFGYTSDKPLNFIAWQFAHRSYAHGLSNIVAIILLVGSGVCVSLCDIFVISSFVGLLALVDPIPFYGMSGLSFLLLGRMISSERALSSYSLWKLPVQIPNVFIMLAIVALYASAQSTQVASVEFLHLFSFLYGFFSVNSVSEWLFRRRSPSSVS